MPSQNHSPAIRWYVLKIPEWPPVGVELYSCMMMELGNERRSSRNNNVPLIFEQPVLHREPFERRAIRKNILLQLLDVTWIMPVRSDQLGMWGERTVQHVVVFLIGHHPPYSLLQVCIWFQKQILSTSRPIFDIPVPPLFDSTSACDFVDQSELQNVCATNSAATFEMIIPPIVLL